jgi:hypothetical protein
MRSLHKLAMVAAATLASGAALASELEAIDRGRLVPSVRVSADFSARGDSPSTPRSGHGIEFGLSGASGEDGQSLSAGQTPVVFGGRVFNAPSELRHEFNFGLVEIAYRFRHFFGDGSFGIEALGGLGYAELELTTTSPSQAASDRLSSVGLTGGFGIVWKFLPATSLQSRISLFASGEEQGVTGAARLDVHVAQALGRNVALRAGLVSWGVVSQREAAFESTSINSRIRAGVSGLSLGLDLMF